MPLILALVIILLAVLGIVPYVVAIPAAVLVAGVSTALSLVMRRRLRATPIRAGPEAMIGARATALTDVGSDGRIRLQSETWRARSRLGVVPAGTYARVLEFEGLCAIVEPWDASGSGSNRRN